LVDYQAATAGSYSPSCHGAQDRCVGFFAFLWGWKWEKTGTWFGLLDTWTEAGGIPSGDLAISFGGGVFEISQDAISPRNVYLSRGEPIFLAAVFRAKFCPWLTGYLNDVLQPMLDEISPDWAWPMKLRRRETW